MSADGLILAAGGSRRMGSPKALLDYRGATFLDTLIGLFAQRCSPVIVTLGAAVRRDLAAIIDTAHEGRFDGVRRAQRRLASRKGGYPGKLKAGIFYP